MKPGKNCSTAVAKAIADFEARWIKCDLCPIASPQKVFWRGELQADIVVMLEYPDLDSEGMGLPGMNIQTKAYLDRLYKVAPDKRWAVVATTACATEKSPDRMHVRNCSSRLLEFIQIANPKLFVCLGKQAQNAFYIALLQREYIVTLTVAHPWAVAQSTDPDTEIIRSELALETTIRNIWPPTFLQLLEQKARR